MNAFLQMWPIYGLSIITGLWFNFFNFKFLFSKIKSGQYTVPYTKHVFEWLTTFTLGAYGFNLLFCYLPATILTAYAYKISVEKFGGLASASIVGWVTNILASVLFMRLLAGEKLNRNGWIAVIIVFIALPFAANSSTNIKP